MFVINQVTVIISPYDYSAQMLLVVPFDASSVSSLSFQLNSCGIYYRLSVELECFLVNDHIQPTIEFAENQIFEIFYGVKCPKCETFYHHTVNQV